MKLFGLHLGRRAAPAPSLATQGLNALTLGAAGDGLRASSSPLSAPLSAPLTAAPTSTTFPAPRRQPAAPPEDRRFADRVQTALNADASAAVADPAVFSFLRPAPQPGGLGRWLHKLRARRSAGRTAVALGLGMDAQQAAAGIRALDPYGLPQRNDNSRHTDLDLPASVAGLTTPLPAGLNTAAAFPAAGLNLPRPYLPASAVAAGGPAAGQPPADAGSPPRRFFGIPLGRRKPKADTLGRSTATTASVAASTNALSASSTTGLTTASTTASTTAFTTAPTSASNTAAAAFTASATSPAAAASAAGRKPGWAAAAWWAKLNRKRRPAAPSADGSDEADASRPEPAWKGWAEKFNARAPRERLMMTAAAVCAVAAVGDALWLTPALRLHKEAGQRHAAAQAAQQQLMTDARRAAVMRTAREAAAKQELSTWRERVRESDDALRAHEAMLVGPERITALLDQVLAGHGRVSVRTMRSLGVTDVLGPAPAPEPLSQAARQGVGAAVTAATAAARGAVATATGAPPAQVPTLYRHGVEVTLEGRYPDLLAYVRALEAAPEHVLWGAVNLQATQHPTTVLTLKLYTLSRDRHWMAL